MTAQTVGKSERPLPTPAASVARMFLDRVAAQPNDEAFRSPILPSEQWVSSTWAETDAKVRRLAGGLLALGIDLEDRVAIQSTTRLDWILADLAIMLAGGATTTVYPSTQPEDVGFILADSGSRLVFAEDASQVAKIAAHRADLAAVSEGHRLRWRGRRRLGDIHGGPRPAR